MSCKPALLLFCLCLVQTAGQEKSPRSLMEIKLELAQEPRPYLHLTPDAIYVYFKTFLLRELPVDRVEPKPHGPLQISRVEDWAPPADRPTVYTDSDPEETLDLLEVDDMPAKFVVLFSDESLWAINPEETRSQVSVYQEIFEWLNSIHPSPHLLKPESITLLHSPDDSARQLYWLLQKDLGVIY